MNRTFACTLILLSAFGAAPALAGETAHLPDLSRALQALIDGRMSLALSREIEPAVESPATGASDPAPRTEHRPSDSASHTDAPGWKPYHSVL